MLPLADWRVCLEKRNTGMLKFDTGTAKSIKLELMIKFHSYTAGYEQVHRENPSGP